VVVECAVRACVCVRCAASCILRRARVARVCVCVAPHHSTPARTHIHAHTHVCAHTRTAAAPPACPACRSSAVVARLTVRCARVAAAVQLAGCVAGGGGRGRARWHGAGKSDTVSECVAPAWSGRACFGGTPLTGVCARGSRGNYDRVCGERVCVCVCVCARVCLCVCAGACVRVRVCG